MKRLASTYGDLFTQVAATVPVQTATLVRVTDTRAGFFHDEATVPAIDIVTGVEGSDQIVRMMTYWQDDNGEWTRACPMCINGTRPEYRHVDAGLCHHCGGTNTVSNGKGDVRTWPTRDKAIKAAIRVSQSDLSTARTWAIFVAIHHHKVEEFWQHHPGLAQARDTFVALAQDKARRDFRNDPYAPVDLDEDGYVDWLGTRAHENLNSFVARMIQEVNDKAHLTPRQAEAMVDAVERIAEQEAGHTENLNATRHVGEIDQRLRFKAPVAFAKRLDNDFGSTVLLILDGEGDYAGAKFKTFSSGAWAWEALELLEADQPCEVTVSATVRAHQTSDRGENVTRLANVRKVKKL